MSAVTFGIVGAMGRMGTTIASLAEKDDRFQLSAAIEHDGHTSLGKEYAFYNPAPSVKPLVVETINNVNLSSLNGLIDFSLPESGLTAAQKAAEAGIPFVSGTTGWTQEQIEEMQKLSEKNPMLLASNMSVGVNLLFELVRLASRGVKGRGFDVEMMEIHHRHKKDAPSGTARTLEKILLEEMNFEAKNIVHGRSGIIGERPDNQIGSLALRGGDVVGDHTVFFLGDGERIELKHQALSRNTFAGGALQALLFIQDKKPAMYSMSDVVNLGL